MIHMVIKQGYPAPTLLDVSFADVDHHILYLPDHKKGIDLTPIVPQYQSLCARLGTQVKRLEKQYVQTVEDFLSEKANPVDLTEESLVSGPFCMGFYYDQYTDPQYSPIVKAMNSFFWTRWALINKEKKRNKAVTNLEQVCHQFNLIEKV